MQCCRSIAGWWLTWCRHHTIVGMIATFETAAEKLPADWAEAPDDPAMAAATKVTAPKHIFRTVMTISPCRLSEMVFRPK